MASNPEDVIARERLSTDDRRFADGERIMVWGRPARVIGQYLNHPDIARFRYEDTGHESQIITHFIDGSLNDHIFSL